MKRRYRDPLPEPTATGFIDIAQRSTKLLELKLLWHNAKSMGLLTDEVKQVIQARAEVVKRHA